MAARIRKDDVVFVRSGDDKGKTGKVLRLVGDNKVVVEGINVVWKHLKPTQQNQRGGRIQKEAPIHISKVQPVDPKTGKGVRVKYSDKDGQKHRIAVQSGNDLGSVIKR
jgi:large subunit ribosomal protein L24